MNSPTIIFIVIIAIFLFFLIAKYLSYGHEDTYIQKKSAQQKASHQQFTGNQTNTNNVSRSTINDTQTDLPYIQPTYPPYIPTQSSQTKPSLIGYADRGTQKAPITQQSISIEVPVINQPQQNIEPFIIAVRFEPKSLRIYGVQFIDNIGRIEFHSTSALENTLTREPFELKQGSKSGLIVANIQINPDVMLPEGQKYISCKDALLQQARNILHNTTQSLFNESTNPMQSSSLRITKVVFDHNNILRIGFYDTNDHWHYMTDPNNPSNQILYLTQYELRYVLNTTTRQLELQVIDLTRNKINQYTNRYLELQADLIRKATRFVRFYDQSVEAFETLH